MLRRMLAASAVPGRRASCGVFFAVCFLTYASHAEGSIRLGNTIESRMANNKVDASPVRRLAYAISQNKGLNKGEDMIVTSGSNGCFNISLLMDGHGGQAVVKHAGRLLQHTLLDHCTSAGSESSKEAWPECAELAIRAYQAEVRREHLRGGATLVAMFLEIATSRVGFAWAGDSSAVIIRNGELRFQTSRHDLENQDELERIESHKPKYRYAIEDGYLCSLERSGGCLMPTRGIGDIDMERAGFLAIPETSDLMDLEIGDIVLIASDGLWDVMDEHAVIEQVMKASPISGTVRKVALVKELVQNAVDEWLRQYGRSSEADDISVLVYVAEAEDVRPTLADAAGTQHAKKDDSVLDELEL